MLTQDIRSASYIRNGAVIAFPAATLCISKHLEFITSGRFVALDKNQWRRKCFELFMCIVLPCLWMFLCTSSGLVSCLNIANPCCQVYCFQAYRYDIVENFGCQSEYWASYVSVLILFIPPLVLEAVTLIYGSEQPSYTKYCFHII